mgnify:CR=1 FL=1
MKIFKNLILFILILIGENLWSLDQEYQRDYCVGYFEELYWALDTIEEDETRNLIEDFFNQKYIGADQLDFDLFYDTKIKQFITQTQNIDTSKYKKVNYPNFEIIILDAYINLFVADKNFCPAFWGNCKEEQLDYFFMAAEDFSNNWKGEEKALFFLEENLYNHHCSIFLRTSINQKKFISDLNILIKELTK